MSKYNGWTNYATWRVNLEMFDGREELFYSADGAQEFVEEIIIETTSEGVARDYALAFLNEVNWQEIYEHYKVEEEEESEATE